VLDFFESIGKDMKMVALSFKYCRISGYVGRVLSGRLSGR
jgi:hypothetical protein